MWRCDNGDLSEHVTCHMFRFFSITFFFFITFYFILLLAPSPHVLWTDFDNKFIRCIVRGSQWEAARESARRQLKVSRMASQNGRAIIAGGRTELASV